MKAKTKPTRDNDSEIALPSHPKVPEVITYDMKQRFMRNRKTFMQKLLGQCLNLT